MLVLVMAKSTRIYTRPSIWGEAYFLVGTSACNTSATDYYYFSKRKLYKIRLNSTLKEFK